MFHKLIKSVCCGHTSRSDESRAPLRRIAVNGNYCSDQTASRQGPLHTFYPDQICTVIKYQFISWLTNFNVHAFRLLTQVVISIETRTTSSTITYLRICYYFLAIRLRCVWTQKPKKIIHRFITNELSLENRTFLC